VPRRTDGAGGRLSLDLMCRSMKRLVSSPRLSSASNARGHSRPFFQSSRNDTDRSAFAGKQALELSVTRREAAECLLASEQIPSNRDVLLHMAATYIKIAIESELAGASTDIIRDGPRGTCTGNRCSFR
jgi:hypothetical protein